jgi:hypothetical protein
MKHFYQNIGEDWFTYSTFYSTVVENAENNAHFVEVGSWKGRSSLFMAVEIINSKKNIKFDCIDPFIEVENGKFKITHEELKNLFINNMKKVEGFYNLYVERSPLVTNRYEDNSIDFVFIDGGHEYEQVYSDIIAWLPKIKVGGYISGHDYIETSCGVKKAVDEIFQNYLGQISTGNFGWIIQVTPEILSIISKD